MRVNYPGHDDYSMDSFVEEYVLQESYTRKEIMRLERQPKAVCSLVSRLLEKMISKGMLNHDDIQYIVQCYGEFELIPERDET